MVFVGAGHNALVAAAYLLDAGRSVCLLEQMPQPGGWLHTAELGAPGFLHDQWSALHPGLVGGQVWAELGPELGRHGLEYVTAPIATASSLPDGRSAVVPVDQDAFAAELDRLGEAAGWQALFTGTGRQLQSFLALLRNGLDEPDAQNSVRELTAGGSAHPYPFTRFSPTSRPEGRGILGENRVTSPADLARQSPNAGPGDHAAGDNSVAQAFAQRPIPAHGGGYRTAVGGVWMIGAATWPGPGINGASGRSLARLLTGAPGA